jgi:hypothetical protein
MHAPQPAGDSNPVASKYATAAAAIRCRTISMNLPKRSVVRCAIVATVPPENDVPNKSDSAVAVRFLGQIMADMQMTAATRGRYLPGRVHILRRARGCVNPQLQRRVKIWCSTTLTTAG